MSLEREPLRVGLAPSLAAWAPEAKYALRVLLRIAGLPWRFQWADAGDPEPLDVYYGPAVEGVRADVWIPAAERSFADAPAVVPRALRDHGDLPYLDFGEREPSGPAPAGAGLVFPSDAVFAAYWLLTGAREPAYARDRWDNLHLGEEDGAVRAVLSTPLVSLYGARLRRHFQQRGRAPLEPSWTEGGTRAAFSFTHDVDYPEIIRSIECLRVLRARGRRGIALVRRVVTGESHFWKFGDWVEFERRIGARPTFYFMARRGSLLRYALGTPDAFYDIDDARFRRLFAELRDEGAEVGLHASFHVHRSVALLQQEKQRLERAAGAAVVGNRHHYWHLDPAAPHETLRRHADAGLLYDSSLAFELYPGFRRGICHPYRPFDPAGRRELGIVQVPPAWMDDHFDGRLAHNGIADPDAAARELVEAAERTGGIVVVDYHVRGMNAEFFPRYGPWLRRFAERHLDRPLSFLTPAEIAAAYVAHEAAVERRSLDGAEAGRRDGAPANSADRHAPELFVVGEMRVDEVPDIARLHHAFFTAGENHGHSIAQLGTKFLEEVFYGLNLDNPYFHVDVARYDGRVVGFSMYTPDRRRVFRHTLRRHFGRVTLGVLRAVLRRPVAVTRHLLGNLAFLTDRVPAPLEDVRGLLLLLAVLPEYRSRAFKERTGIWVADELWDSMEWTLRAHGCGEVCTSPGEHNTPVNRLFQKHGAEFVARVSVQGVPSNYYRKRLL